MYVRCIRIPEIYVCMHIYLWCSSIKQNMYKHTRVHVCTCICIIKWASSCGYLNALRRNWKEMKAKQTETECALYSGPIVNSELRIPNSIAYIRFHSDSNLQSSPRKLQRNWNYWHKRHDVIAYFDVRCSMLTDGKDFREHFRVFVLCHEKRFVFPGDEI